MQMLNQKKSFTLLELIIVIIIIGVLVSLALPRLFSVVRRRAYSVEAVVMLRTVHEAIQRCLLMNNIDMKNSAADLTVCGSISDLDIKDPFESPGSHFSMGFSGNFNLFCSPQSCWYEILAVDREDQSRILLHHCYSESPAATPCGAGLDGGHYPPGTHLVGFDQYQNVFFYKNATLPH